MAWHNKMCSNLVNMHSAVLDEVFCGSHKWPHDLCQAWANLCIQNINVALKETHLIPGQQTNDSDTDQKFNTTSILIFDLNT